MIYRGIRINMDKKKRKDWLDVLKAIGITVIAVVVIASVVVLIGQLGIR
jgi:hypothetical protein